MYGDLPPGVHPAPLNEAVLRFGLGSGHRVRMARRLERIHSIARSTGYLARFVDFGSFVTTKQAPNDIDVFMIMRDTFEVGTLFGETLLLFDHSATKEYFGASVFWLRHAAALGGVQATIEHWQITRAGHQRGIVEILEEPDDHERP